MYHLRKTKAIAKAQTRTTKKKIRKKRRVSVRKLINFCLSFWDILNHLKHNEKFDQNYDIVIVEEAAAKAEAAAKDLSTQQAVAVLGLALVAMGEDIGSEMLFRHFGHLLR